VSNETGAVVLFMTAGTILAVGRMMGGNIDRALFPIAINIFAVATIFAAFAASVDIGMDVRPHAKFVDGVAAGFAALAVTQIVENDLT
jgi:hypothetical protein